MLQVGKVHRSAQCCKTALGGSTGVQYCHDPMRQHQNAHLNCQACVPQIQSSLQLTGPCTSPAGPEIAPFKSQDVLQQQQQHAPGLSVNARAAVDRIQQSKQPAPRPTALAAEKV